jgi:DNA-damage-inducible protein D
LYEKIVQLKFEVSDVKKYANDCLETQNLLRLIQSIPSPKAEPFKTWLAKVGYERMQEMALNIIFIFAFILSYMINFILYCKQII